MHRLSHWIAEDSLRSQILTCVAGLHLPDAWVAAGFVRNLVWDRLHEYKTSTPLTDIDVIYFDSACIDPERDAALERQLKACIALPWSVKNQARMHTRNGDLPYHSSLDAMSYWVEVETALAARLLPTGQVEIASPFTQAGLFNLYVTPNPKRCKPEAFRQRQREKGWARQWSKLQFLPAVDMRLNQPDLESDRKNCFSNSNNS
ncbi:nitrate reductase [Pseudomonas asuensis]|uniref:Nitrate reductase n=1 Tax=Pseudomonas asuensis TaxID=1825787 RepID=A0ABQ2GTX7_9PSED|nr:nucleotidyltransferase family protein [Pseudomonas asuensis]GGM11900.1 nitrate reductase [Pseudomonas asuensis]